MSRTLSNDEPSEREPADAPVSAHDVTDYATERTFTRRRSRNSMLLFGVLMTGLMGVYFTCLKTGPQQASAAAVGTLEPDTAGHAIANFLSAGPVNVKAMQKQVQSLQFTADDLTAAASAAQVPLTALKTNPFGETSADESKPQQKAAVLRAVGALQLQSILITDKNRSCTINHALYVEGQPIDRFIVEKIASNGVILRSGEWRFELKQQ